MLPRVIGGVVLCLIGAVWIAQGLDVLKGSEVMSGHPFYAFLGLVAVVVGIWLVAAGAARRGRASSDQPS
jgi:uncharacterized membrane protein